MSAPHTDRPADFGSAVSQRPTCATRFSRIARLKDEVKVSRSVAPLPMLAKLGSRRIAPVSYRTHCSWGADSAVGRQRQS
jgi:hypothetical protein